MKSRSAPDQRQWYLDHFGQYERSLNGGAGTPLHQIRRAAIERFAETGLPTNRDEEWKNGNVGAVVGTGLNSGAVERYTGHATVRPSSWSDPEFARFLGALRAEGRSLYLLDDGEEMEIFVRRFEAAQPLRLVGEFELPVLGLGGQPWPRRARLYALE